MGMSQITVIAAFFPSKSACVNTASLDCLAHLFRRGGLALDRLTRLCQRNSVAESRTSRQAECRAYFFGQFRLHDSQVAIGDRFLLWPPTRITRLPGLPSYEVGEATRVFSAAFFLCFFSLFSLISFAVLV
jgi:hypothetical protein